MRISPKTYFLIFLLAVMAAVIGISFTFSAWESKMLPLFIAGLVTLLLVIQLRKELSEKKKSTGETDEETTDVKGTGFGTMLGWLFGLPLAIYLLGFLIAIPIFMLSYIKLRGRSWIAAITLTVVTTGLIYLVFELGFRADLWKGVFFE